MIDPRKLWFSLVAPPLAFGLEGAIGWWAGNGICTSMPVAAGRALVGSLTVVMLGIACAGLLMGVRNYRQAAATAEAAADRVEFMALGGVFVSGSFIVGLLWFGMNPMLIDVCGGMR